MNVNVRISQGDKVLNVKWIWIKGLFRFLFCVTMNPEKGGLTYTFTHGDFIHMRHKMSRSRWDLILD